MNPGPRSSYTHRLYHLIRQQKRDFWLSNAYGIAATLLMLPLPMLLPLLIDEVLLGHPGRLTAFLRDWLGSAQAWQMILLVLGATLFLRIAAFFFSLRKTYHATRLSQRVAYELRRRILDHLERVSLAHYETLKPGGVSSRTIQDVERIAALAGQTVSTLLGSTLMLLGIAAVMVWMNPLLALLVFTLNPLFFGFSRILGRKTSRYLRRQQEAYQLYQELLSETLELFAQVRASNQERPFFDLLRQRAAAIEEAATLYGYKAALASSGSTLLTQGVVDLFRAAGIAAVAYSDLSVGMMIAFLFYLSTLVRPIQQLSNLLITWRGSRPAFERIDELLALEREPDYPVLRDPFAGRHSCSVAVERLSFAYREGQPILRGIDLNADAGEKIALIGPSGGGKSTLAQLLVGFYRPQEGRILYGGVPMEEIGLSRIRENVALMLQESLFFNDTIRMNLALSRSLDDERIYEALRMARLDDFVRSLPEGLETLIGKNGIRLSGGQRQRLAIARIILSDPKVVIFDEATSALDNETEARLYESLAPFLEGRTVIIVAHRETTIRQAQRLYLVEEGRIAAEGDYVSMKARGLIRENYDL